MRTKRSIANHILFCPAIHTICTIAPSLDNSIKRQKNWLLIYSTNQMRLIASLSTVVCMLSFIQQRQESGWRFQTWFSKIVDRDNDSKDSGHFHHWFTKERFGADKDDQILLFYSATPKLATLMDFQILN